MSPALQGHLAWFASLSPAALKRIDQVYASNCHFQDPFNDVQGREQAHAIYAHMFATTEAPRFIIERVLENSGHAAVFWRFQCRIRGRSIDVPGMSELRLDDQGLIADHVDYWDSAELFAQLPVLGSAVRWLKRKLALPA